jgi:2'-5' RNA ligase
MSARYAIYLAPPPDSAIWRFGSRVIGRDAATGEAIEGYAPQGYSPEAWRAVTAAPRLYGFHATLKAPFRLQEGCTPEELETEIAALAASVAAFDLGPLQVSSFRFSDGGFVALRPVRASARLAELEALAVRQLDRFRAPPNEAEMARRRPERLTTRQRELLAVWGYPYVLDEFRLHFTLSGATDKPDALAESLADDFARAIAAPGFRVDALTLFVQQESADFYVKRRFALSAGSSSRTRASFS